jgi:hypothetical protein
MGCSVSWEGRWGGQWWRLEAPVERKKKGEGRLFSGKPGRKSLFCANFELPFANRLSMKIDPIYRAGQRVISSSMGKTSQPLIRLE